MNISSTGIKFQPNWKLLLVGRSQFQRPVDAMAEFIDNSIQANMNQGKPEIRSLLFLDEPPQSPSFLVFLDNGIGMDPEGITAFATFALDQTTRGLAPDSKEKNYGKFISKFGVGAKQAGFYLGNRITLLTKPCGGSNQIHRFCFDEKQLEENSRRDAAFESIVETFSSTDSNELWLPWFDEMLPFQTRCHSEVNNIIVQHLQGVSNGTAIVVRLLPAIVERLRSQTTKDLAIQLKDIYHFHLRPDDVRFSDVANNSKFQRLRMHGKGGTVVDMRVETRGFVGDTELGIDEFHLNEDEGVSDFLDECHIKTKTPFELVMGMKPMLQTSGNSSTTEKIQVFGLFWYLPFSKDKEQRPQLDSSICSTDMTKLCIIRCYWQNRLVPLTTLDQLPIMKSVDQQLDRWNITPKWRSRIVGILFLDWSFNEIANNKMRISGDISKHINDDPAKNLLQSKSANEFAKWLEEQCKSDEEFHFANLILSAPSHIPTFGALRYNLNGGRKELIKDQKVSMSLSTDDSPKVPIILKGFQANGLLSRRAEAFGAGKILYQRLPEDVYGTKGYGDFPTQLLYNLQPNQLTQASEKKMTDALKPYSIYFGVASELGQVPIPVDSSLIIPWGTKYYRWAVQINLPDKSLAWHLPNMKDEQQFRYHVQVVITNAHGRNIKEWLTNELYMYDGNERNDVAKKPSSQNMAKKCYYSFYTISVDTFNRQSGKYTVKVSVLNPDKQLLLNRNISLTLLPQEVKSIELQSNYIREVKLGECIPALSFKFKDCLETPMILENVRMHLSCKDAGVTIVRGNSEESTNHGDGLKFSDTTWQISPLPNRLGLLSNHKNIILNKLVELVATFNHSQHGQLPVKVNIPMIIVPGSPKFIRAPEPIIVDASETNITLNLVVEDDFGNRASPGQERWTASLSVGHLMLSSRSRPTVQLDGSLIISNIAITEQPYQTLDIAQTIILKRDDNSVVLSYSVPVQIKVPHVEQTIEFYRAGTACLNCTLKCSANEEISDLTYSLVDENGSELEIPSDALFTVEFNGLKNRKKGKQNQFATGKIAAFKVPQESGEYEMTLKLTVHGMIREAVLTIVVIPGVPHKWTIVHHENNINARLLIAGELNEGLRTLIEGVNIVDFFGNIVTDTSIIDRYSPELLIRYGDHLVELPPLRLCRYDEVTPASNKKRKASTDSSPAFLLPNPIAEGLLNEWSTTLKPRTHIEIVIISRDGTVKESSIIHQTIELGLPTQVFISSESLLLLVPVITEHVVVNEQTPCTDITLSIKDVFGETHNLKGYSYAVLKVLLNDTVISTQEYINNINELLSKPVSLPIQEIKRGIASVREHARNNNAVEGSFELHFLVSIKDSKSSNKKMVELLPASLTCFVRIQNNVIGIQAELFDDKSNEALGGLGMNRVVAAGTFIPRIELSILTEDGKPLPDTQLQCFGITMTKIKPKQKATEIVSVGDYYSTSFKACLNRKNMVYLEPKVMRYEEANLSYKMEITYTENRSQISRIDPKTEIILSIQPGAPSNVQFDKTVVPRIRKAVCASSLGNVNDIGKDLHVTVFDAYKNPTSFNGSITCHIVATNETDSSLNPPKLASRDGCGIVECNVTGSGSSMSRKFSKLALDVSDYNQHATDGKCTFCFTLYDANKQKVASNISEVEFEFTSNQKLTAALQALEEKRGPWQSTVEEYDQKRTRLEDIIKRKKQLLLETQCKDTDFKRYREMLQQNLNDLKTRNTLVFSAKKPTNYRERLGSWRDSDKVIGQVVDIALVKDKPYIDIVSSACKRVMDVFVTADVDTAKALMHLGLKSTSPKLYVPFKPKTRGRAISGELELDPIVDQSGKLPAGNPRYLVNLIYLPEDKEYLRSTLFFNVLKFSIVFDTFDQVLNYRQYLVNNDKNPPPLYSLDGRCLGTDGILDPTTRNNNDEYKFGEYYDGSSQIRNIAEELQKMEQLILLETDFQALSNDINRGATQYAAACKKVEEYNAKEMDIKNLNLH